MDKTKYAKYISLEKVSFLTSIPNMSNPKPSSVKKYALENGYKEVNYNEQPNEYYKPIYINAGNNIIQAWAPLDLADCKISALTKIQNNLTTALSERAIVYCEYLDADIVYDTDACINATSMVSDGYCSAYVDANDNIHTLNLTGVSKVAETLKAYRTSLYTEAQSKRYYIEQATSVDDL